MKFIGYIIFYMILGVLVGILDWPFYIIGIIVAIALVISLGNLLYTAMYTQNLKKLEKFIKGNSRNPVYYSLQMLAEGTDDQFRESLESIIKKYKNTKYEATYGALLAMMNGDYELAHRYNEPQLHKEVGQYTNYIIDVMAGKEIGDVPAFKESWMNSSIEAHQAAMRMDLQTFEIMSRQATDQAKGIQYYGNYYTFKRMKERLSESLSIQ